MNPNVLCVIMGGGRGTRLNPLTKLRCKPAVPLAGKFRLVDIPISNCLNSGINKIFVLTQFNTASLHRHIQESYKFDPFGGGFVDILSAEQTERGDAWYQGTADAVRQNLHHFGARDNDLFLIVSGDQLYRMDLAEVIQQHLKTKADVTIAAKALPLSAIDGLGLMRVDDELNIREFAEKPKDPKVVQSLAISDALKERMPSLDGEKQYALANMGIYVFNRRTLFEALEGDTTDFGKEVIPGMLGKVKMCGFIFDGYWEDIGTVRSFFDANLALTDPNPPFDFYDARRPIYTHARYLPAARVRDSKVESAIVADGATLNGCTVKRSVIGVRARVDSGTELENVVLMGADYFETEESRKDCTSRKRPCVGVGKNCKIRNAIIDKNARIGDNVELSPEGKPDLFQQGDVYVRDGVLLVAKDGVVPSGTKI
ncbi:MAG: glucose-1-phosphate adenylyltransferase [Opitutales bacterium]|nr:glucose-1-phosphate adenylyltransferase [Opitutales bacterium]